MWQTPTATAAAAVIAAVLKKKKENGRDRFHPVRFALRRKGTPYLIFLGSVAFCGGV